MTVPLRIQQAQQRLAAGGLASGDGGAAHAAARAPAATAAAPRSPRSQPVFRFGVLSDVQHADIDDGHGFHGTPRYYRHSLEALDRAVGRMLEDGVDCAIHLGDIIGGLCSGHQGQHRVWGRADGRGGQDDVGSGMWEVVSGA